MKSSRKEDLEMDQPSCCGDQGQIKIESPQPQIYEPGDTQWINGTIKTAAGDVPVVKTDLNIEDRLGACKARWGIGRMRFIVAPGLYAVGAPIDKSPVFVTANFKLSFDRLRTELSSIDGWILVLDTRGINVWCAAGKGTFGTDELVSRIKSTRLENVVSHRKLILPQLGAPGVAAHEVKDRSGFRVIYGPVQARDIPAFMEAGQKATAQMRRVDFPIRLRAALVPVEWTTTYKYYLWAALGFLILSGLYSGGYSFDRLLTFGSVSLVLILGVFILGIALPPLLLPWVPGRSFSFKGGIVGIIIALGILWHAWYFPEMYPGRFSVAAWFLIVPAVVSFTAMNFTGSSTYTSLSGVLKEMRRALPLQIGAVVIGLGLWITGLFI